MAKEIERKFLVDMNCWHPSDSGSRFLQGYLPMSEKTKVVVRVRISGNRSWLTIKGENRGMMRPEFEYPIPLADAVELLDGLCVRPFIEKIRYSMEFAGMDWVVDVFEGDNAGLVVAEIELASEDQKILLPPWVGKEVTDDPRYYNSNLMVHPFCRW
ncbi:MAG: CYTH domain-containing protein [Desulfobacteraceae bacterium]|nr:MAG: CYTH domain-containing protein [Desulfobacteraceae bacterium]